MAGLLGGLLGVGGGFLMVPLQVGWGRVPAHNAAANSLIAVITISVVAGFLYYFAAGSRPEVDLRIAILFGVGGVGGAFLGARYARRIPERALLIAITALLAGIGIKELVAP